MTASTVPEGCPLSQREFEVLQLLADGRSYAQISVELGVAPTTIRTHVHLAYQRLGARDKVTAVMVALEHGWITASGRSHASNGRRAPILDELAKLDDRGLELAEAVLHQHRQANPDDPYTLRALKAVDQVRVITREMCSYDRDWMDELRNDRRIT